MKIVVDESEQYDDVEIVIRCKRYDENVLSLLARIKADDDKIIGTLDGKSHVIDEKDVLYFDSVDKRSFVYTIDKVYETPLRLYEIERRLRFKGFFRATKSSVINIAKITNIRPSFNSILILEMENGEKLTVSRQYAPLLKERLGNFR